MSAPFYGSTEHTDVLHRIFEVQNGLIVVVRSVSEGDHEDAPLRMLLEMFAEKLGELASDLSIAEDVKARVIPTVDTPPPKKARR